jgi:proteic killer suppression protein
VIENFRHRGLKRLYQRGDRSALGADVVDKIERILTLLDAADRPEALDLPGMAFHPLKGDLKGFYAVTVRANWRLIYRFENGNAYDVSLVDYH